MNPASKRIWLPLLIIAAGIIAAFALDSVQVAKWGGHKTLQVQVQVIDTDVPQVVSGAEVTIFDGPQTPIEGSVSAWKRSDFVPDPQSSLTETRVTDSNGLCSFSYPFSASGSDGPLVHSGAVLVSRAWLRVSALDRPSTLIPVDRQSVRGRDIDDNTPLVVTVVLNKYHPD